MVELDIEFRSFPSKSYTLAGIGLWGRIKEVKPGRRKPMQDQCKNSRHGTVRGSGLEKLRGVPTEPCLQKKAVVGRAEEGRRQVLPESTIFRRGTDVIRPQGHR